MFLRVYACQDNAKRAKIFQRESSKMTLEQLIAIQLGKNEKMLPKETFNT